MRARCEKTIANCRKSAQAAPMISITSVDLSDAQRIDANAPHE